MSSRARSPAAPPAPTFADPHIAEGLAIMKTTPEEYNAPAKGYTERWVTLVRSRIADDCGHSTYFEKPAVFNRLVMDFLARRG